MTNGSVNSTIKTENPRYLRELEYVTAKVGRAGYTLKNMSESEYLVLNVNNIPIMAFSDQDILNGSTGVESLVSEEVGGNSGN